MITGFQLGRIKVPLKTPFKTALRTVYDIDDLVVIIETSEGDIGVGSAPSTPQITGCTHKSSTAAIEDYIFPAINGRDPEDLSSLTALVQGCVEKNNNAKAAVEIALYDLWAKRKQLPLYKALGGNQRELTTCVTISANPTHEMIADIEKAITRGFKTVKLKTGNDWHADVVKLRKIQGYVATLLNKVDIIVDANQGWTAEQTIDMMRECRAMGMKILAIEQPVKHNDIKGLINIRERIDVPLMVDETAFNLKQVRYLLDNGAADIVNIKLAKASGLSQAIEIAKLASSRMIPCMMGSMLEGSIAVAAAAHLAAAMPRAFTLVDLDGPSLGEYNPISGGTQFSNASITLNNTPGLGITEVPTLKPNILED